ncbi:MAG: membrane protein insertase YidC [Acidobacteria bacterium]|nr:membrane protein insertase YidC [Acidobacteriota bacterium]MCW5968524.1 membrane protein insertase YidC [Blastocatellales bacterium]
MQKRFILFLALSAAIFLGWQFFLQKYFPEPVTPPPAQESVVSPAGPTADPTAAPGAEPAALAQNPDTAAAETTVAELREIRIQSDFWVGRLLNEGAVLTEWTVTHFTDGKAVDAQAGGVNLISPITSREIGAAFRLVIPGDAALEKLLNTARYEVEDLPENDIRLGRDEQREISFVYRGRDIYARKSLVFNGSGYDFDLKIEVARSGQPVEAFVIVGPNFGDQTVTEYSTYRPAPQVSYAVGASVSRDYSSSVQGPGPYTIAAAPIRWASIDDNYFAMALVPARPATAISLFNTRRSENINGKSVERDYLAVAVPVVNGQASHVYAGPKDMETLARVSEKFGLGDASGNLEDIVSYGWLSFLSLILKPLAQFMLKSLLAINEYTHNYGWAIVVLTIVLNMFFFPLRWKSSVAMRKTAAMQPKMKDLQERMKKIDKNDPRMLELQREQMQLMKEGNPLMGCLPLFLQMPFFLAVFTILTISIEVRHAPFIAWIKDLSSPDPYFILPVAMCASMIIQQALTPTTADPMQKRIGYLMPLIFAYFLTSAPAGLVLYWMVGNLVGIGQQFVINRLNPPPKPAATNNSSSSPAAKGKKTKAEMARS